jgi:hypothetical protein
MQEINFKSSEIVCGWGSAPDPAGGAYDAPPDPLIKFARALRALDSRTSRSRFVDTLKMLPIYSIPTTFFTTTPLTPLAV